MLNELLAAAGVPGPSDDFWYEKIGSPTYAGINVTEESAMRFSTVFACIQKIAKTLSTLPVHVYEKTGPRETQIVDHELNDILDWNGSQNATGISVRSSLHTNRLAWGDGVAEITYTNGGKIAHLTPLLSRNLKPIIGDDGTLLWEHYIDGRLDTTLTPDKYFHDPGPFTYNGLTGITPIQSKETIAGGMAAQTFANSFFGNGARPGGFLEFPKDIDLSDERMDQLVEQFNQNWQGAKNAHRVGRLREGVTFKDVGMPIEDMQLLELRKFSRIEICSIFDVPPPMIQELDPGKYTAIEQAMIAWVRDSLLSIAKATEAAFKRRFFPDSRLYVKHNLAGLARGDTAARSDFYSKGIQWGWFTVNDVRELEDMNPIDGGDVNWIQMNMMPLTSGGQVVPANQDGQAAKESQTAIVIQTDRSGPPQIDADAIARQVAESVAATVRREPADTSAAFGPILEDVAWRIATKEDRAIRNALKRYQNDAIGYLAWCDEFYTGHIQFVRKAIEPVVCGIERLRGETMSERPADFAARYCNEKQAGARSILSGSTVDGGYLMAELRKAYLLEKEILT
ncbi:phage portal protein [Petrachloros mirabilis]